MNKLAYASVFLLITFSAFGQQKLPTTQQKFDLSIKFSGNNAPELLKVIDHYSLNKKDSLKLKAAYFLIANMTGSL
jgi:hypothetical protein